MAPGKKNAARRKAALVFIDESGFLMAPLVRRTWAPVGVTPILLQRTRRHAKVSAIAALVVPPARDRIWCYFRLYGGLNINAARIVAFLRQLERHLEGPATLIWDRLQAHRARPVQAFIQRHRWHNEFLPPYAPELNPVEYLWSHEKTSPLANAAAFDVAELLIDVRRAIRRAQNDPALLRALFNHSGLFLRLM